MSKRPVRVPPVPFPEYRELVATHFGREVGDESSVLNVTRTWAQHPALMVAQRPLQDHLMNGGILAPRERELAILRIGWRCGSEYEFGQHTVFGRQAGLTDAEITRVTRGPGDSEWSEFEALLLTAVDELYEEHRVGEQTWNRLSAAYSVEQLIEFVSLVGRYWTVSAVLNTIGVELEAGRQGFPTEVTQP